MSKTWNNDISKCVAFTNMGYFAFSKMDFIERALLK